MSRYLLCILALVVLTSAFAVGTKKKRRKIHVRREFVLYTQAELPVEYHSPLDTYHSLRYRGTGLEGWRWRREPQPSSGWINFDEIDRMVADSVRAGIGVDTSAPGHFNLLLLAVRYWKLPNGYEYVIEERVSDRSVLDSLMRDAGQRRSRKALR